MNSGAINSPAQLSAPADNDNSTASHNNPPNPGAGTAPAPGTLKPREPLTSATFEDAFELSHLLSVSVTEATIILIRLDEAGLEIRPKAGNL